MPLYRFRRSGESLLENIYYCQEELINEIRKLYRLRSETIKHINFIIDELNDTKLKVNISKVVGSSVGIVGGGLSIAGLLLAPVTLGGSVALTIIGSGAAAVGGMVTAGATIAEKIISNEKLKKAQEAIEADNEQVERAKRKYNELAQLSLNGTTMIEEDGFQPSFLKAKRVWKSFKQEIENIPGYRHMCKVYTAFSFFYNIFALAKNSGRIISCLWDTAQVFMMGVEMFAAKQSRIASIITKYISSTAFKVADGLFMCIGLVMDIATLISTLYDMHKGSKSDVAKQLVKEVARLHEEQQLWNDTFFHSH